MSSPPPDDLFASYQNAMKRAFDKMGIVPDMHDALVATSLVVHTYTNKPDPLGHARNHIRKCNYPPEVQQEMISKLERFAPYFNRELS